MGKDYLHIQILTIEELLHGAEVKMPPQYGTFKEAQTAHRDEAHPQLDLQNEDPHTYLDADHTSDQLKARERVR